VSCDEIKNLLDEYISGELDDTVKTEVEQHLAACSACNAEYNALKALKSELKSLAEPLPEKYEARLISKIRKHKRTRFVNVLGASVAAAVVLVCAVGIGMDEFHKYMVNRESIAEQFSAARDYNTEESAESNREADTEDNTEINYNADSTSMDSGDNASTDIEDKDYSLNNETAVSDTPENAVQPVTTDSHSESAKSMPVEEVQPEVTSAQSDTTTDYTSLDIKRAYTEDTVTEETDEYEAYADIYLCIDEDDFAELRTKLNSMFASEQLDYTDDGVLIYVTDRNYETFREELKDFSLDYDRDQINNIDEKSLNYRVSVTVKKK
jgi:hypothetical protein